MVKAPAFHRPKFNQKINADGTIAEGNVTRQNKREERMNDHFKKLVTSKLVVGTNADGAKPEDTNARRELFEKAVNTRKAVAASFGPGVFNPPPVALEPDHMINPIEGAGVAPSSVGEEKRGNGNKNPRSKRNVPQPGDVATRISRNARGCFKPTPHRK